MKTILGTLVALVLLLASAGVGQAALNPQSPFSVVWDEAPVELAAGSTFTLRVTIRVPEGYYLSASETDVDFASLEGLLITDVRYPRAAKVADPYLGKEVDVYRGDVTIAISGRVPEGLDPGERDLLARIAFRGCSPTICYRAEEAEALFRVAVGPSLGAPKPAPRTAEPPAGWAEEGPAPAPEPFSLRRLLEVQDFGVLLQRGLGWTLLIVFVAGILTSLTPCVWPVIPVVLLFVGVHPHKRFKDNVLLAATLVTGLVLVYALLGIAAVALGKNLGFLYQQRWFLAVVVLFFLAMSLAMFGVFDVRLPRRLQQRLHRMGGEGYRGAFLAGMGTGLVASPCAGPILAALLGYVALQGNYAAGFALLVVYGTGMGLLIVLIGAGYGELAGKLKSGPWMLWIRRLLGILLLFPAAFYMGSLFRWSTDAILGAGDRPRIAWMADEATALQIADASGKPVMLEFSAEWCPPCKALDDRFFSRLEIIDLAGRVVPLRVDATIETPEARRMIRKYRVAGWPTVLFLDSKGRPWRDLRVNDYNPAAAERALREAIRRAEEPTAGP